MLFSLTAPVQSHLSFILSGSPFDPCFVCHSSFPLHTENTLTQRLWRAGLSRAGYVTLQPPVCIPVPLWASGHCKHTLGQHPGSQHHHRPPRQMCYWLSIYLPNIALNSVSRSQDKTSHSKQCIFTIST